MGEQVASVGSPPQNALDRLFADSGMERREVVACGVAFVVLMVAWTVGAWLVPVEQRVVTLSERFEPDLGIVAWLAGWLGSVVIAFAVSYRLVVGRRPRFCRPKPWWVRPDVPAFLVSYLAIVVLRPPLPRASGLYPLTDTPPTWLDVTATADIACALVLWVLLSTAVFVGVTLVLLPIHAAVLRREARGPRPKAPKPPRELTPAETWPPGADDDWLVSR